MEFFRKKNVATNFSFPMVTTANPETFITGATVADAAYYSDAGGAFTTLAITDTVSEIGTTGMYDLSLTAAEMNHDIIIIKLTATSAANSAIIIRTRVVDLEDVVRATTPGNTLDIASTGEAGIDLGNTLGNFVAADFGAASLNGKGDWNVNKTGYTLTQSFPSNFASMSITAGGLIDVTQAAADKAWASAARTLTALGFTYAAGDFGAASLNGKGDWNINKTGYTLTTQNWNVGKTGYSLTQAFPSNFASLAITAGGVANADVTAINGSTTAAVQLALSANEIESGLCEGTPTTSIIQTDLVETQNDIYIGRTIIFTGGNARGEATDITDYDGATGTVTVTTLANAPAVSDPFIIL